MVSKHRKALWIDRRCCDWDTFLCSLMNAAYRMNFPLILVDRCEARRYWRRYSCTGAEVIRMQRGREMNDALYNGYGEPPRRDPPGQDGDGGEKPVSPAGPRPVPSMDTA